MLLMILIGGALLLWACAVSGKNKDRLARLELEAEKAAVPSRTALPHRPPDNCLLAKPEEATTTARALEEVAHALRSSSPIPRWVIDEREKYTRRFSLLLSSEDPAPMDAEQFQEGRASLLPVRASRGQDGLHNDFQEK